MQTLCCHPCKIIPPQGCSWIWPPDMFLCVLREWLFFSYDKGLFAKMHQHHCVYKMLHICYKIKQFSFQFSFVEVPWTCILSTGTHLTIKWATFTKLQNQTVSAKSSFIGKSWLQNTGEWNDASVIFTFCAQISTSVTREACSQTHHV